MAGLRLPHCLLLSLMLWAPIGAQAGEGAAKPALPTGGMVASTPAAPTKIAVIDVPRILQESLAAQSVQKQLEAQRAKFQAEVSVQEKTLHDDDVQLKELRNTKTSIPQSEAELGDREQKLRQRFMAMERDVQTKRHALDEAFAAGMAVVRDAVLAVVQEISKGRGVQAVLLKQQVLWVEPTLDMTNEVLAKLNARLTEVPVKLDLSALPAVLPDNEKMSAPP
jgi:outer membrane protein